MFDALILDKDDEDNTFSEIKKLEDSDLPEGDVKVKVEYSTLNYKDCLAITGLSPIIKSFPMVPGIDLAGIVEYSLTDKYKVNDKVILNGWGVGEKHWGGISQKASLKNEWLIPLVEPFSLKQAMTIGTAGYTAMLCVIALEKNGISKREGEILVTGAAGGVGSVAISVLSKLGYKVVASTGRVELTDYLKNLGASDVIDRRELSEKGKVLGRERWAGAIDTLGSYTLANICSTTKYGGVIAACGLAQGYGFPATVMPFILRGIKLIGIDSVYCPLDERLIAWRRLSNDLDTKHIEMMSSEISLNQVSKTAKDMMNGKTYGRVIINVNE